MMKRLQIIQSNIEPNKNVLWLDRYKNLNIYAANGWENIIKAPCENIINNVKHNFTSSGFIMNNVSQLLYNINNEEIQNEEYAKYIGEIDNQGNTIATDLVWNNEIGGFPTPVLLEIGKVYLIKYIITDNFKYLILVPYNVPQVDWNETDFNSRYYIKNKPTIPTNVSDLSNDAGYITLEEIALQVQSDWDEVDLNSPAFIKNKPEIDFNYTVKSASIIAEAQSKSIDVEPFNIYKYNIYSNINNTKYSLLNLNDLKNDKNINIGGSIKYTKDSIAENYINLLYCSRAEGYVVFKIIISDTTHNSTSEHYCCISYSSLPDSTCICYTTLSWDIIIKNYGEDEIGFIYTFLKVPRNFIGSITIKPLFYNEFLEYSSCGTLVKSESGDSHYPLEYFKDNQTDLNSNFFDTLKIEDQDLSIINPSLIKEPYGKYEIDFIDDFGELQLGDTITNDKIKSLIKEGWYV